MKGSRIPHNPVSTLLLAAALMGALLIVAPPSALVASAAAQSDADIEKAKEKFRIARDLYEDEEYGAAADTFYEAYELSNRSELLYNVGRAYWKDGELKEAEEHLQAYLNALPDAPNADEVVEAIIQIQEEMAAQMSNVEVDATRAGVDVFVDDEDEPRCQTPCSVSMLPGEHTLTARPADMEAISRTIEVEANQPSSMRFEIPGQLHIETDQRSGTVRIAGGEQFRLPLNDPIPLSAGTHRVTVVGDDARWSGDIEVAGGELTHILVPLGAAGEGAGAGPLRTASYSLLGVSAGLLVGGIVMGMQAGDTHATLEEQQTSQRRLSAEMIEQGKGEQAGANLMYALSAASFATGAGLFAWDWLGGQGSAEEEISPTKTPSGTESQPGSQPKERGEGQDVDLLGADDAPAEDASSDELVGDGGDDDFELY